MDYKLLYMNDLQWQHISFDHNVFFYRIYLCLFTEYTYTSRWHEAL